jgi:hypothetical protein
VTAVLSHSLGAGSPFVRLGLGAIRRASGAILVLVEGTDEVTGSPLLQLHHYRIDDILEGHVFDDLDALHRTRLIGAPSDSVRSDPSKRSARR